MAIHAFRSICPHWQLHLVLVHQGLTMLRAPDLHVTTGRNPMFSAALGPQKIRTMLPLGP
jgi:hypothetical protein